MDAECAFVYILDLTDVEFLDDSSTESLLLSGDEYNQDFDSTNFEESQDEDEALNEIVRCVCELDEENGFMIQVGRPLSRTWAVTPAARRAPEPVRCACALDENGFMIQGGCPPSAHGLRRWLFTDRPAPEGGF